MSRRIAVLCVLAAQAFGGQIATAAPKHDSRKHASKPGKCAGAESAPVDEATRRRASRVVLCLVNRARRAHRVPPLRRSKPLAKAAVRHSAAMVGGKYFSHFSFGGADVRRRATRAGYVRKSRQTILGETLAWGAGPSATPMGLVMLFMSSPPHRATMLSRRYRDLGIGLALGAPATNVADSAATLTLNFGRRSRRR